MRSTWWGLLLGLGLVCAPLQAQVATPLPANNADATQVIWTWEVTGYGPHHDDAHLAALREAQTLLTESLRQEYPNLDWTPTPEQFRRWGMVTEIQHDPQFPLDIGPVHLVKLRIELRDPHLQQIFAQAHKERQVERQLLTARVLGGLVALLLVFTGYFRLEEMTRGYYTGLLRLLALAILGLVGATLWWLR